MTGILEDIFNVRTNGNGFVRSWWDNILLLRDLEQLISEGRVKLLRDVPRTNEYPLPDYRTEAKKKWVQDCETGDIYEYIGPYERSVPSFRKLDIDDLMRVRGNARPM